MDKQGRTIGVSVIMVIFDAKTHSMELPPTTYTLELLNANMPLLESQLNVGGFWHHISYQMLMKAKAFYMI
jgi:hypothetical protein